MTRIAVAAFFLLAAVSAFAQDIDPPRHGRIELASEPRGAEVFLGDSLLGRTPLRIAREHAADVRLYYPSRSSWNVQVAALGETLPSADEGIALVRFRKMLLLRTLPYGCRVFRDDSLLGVTPLQVSADGGMLRIEALDHESVDWDPASTTRDEYLLVLEAMDEGVTGKVEYRNGGFRLPSVDVLLPAGFGLAAGVAAVIFKQKADARYEDYLASGNEELLSDTKKYDIYAGISLALLQFGLGYFIYRLFDE